MLDTFILSKTERMTQFTVTRDASIGKNIHKKYINVHPLDIFV